MEDEEDEQKGNFANDNKARRVLPKREVALQLGIERHSIGKRRPMEGEFNGVSVLVL